MGFEEELLQGMKEAIPTATGRGEVADEVKTPPVASENTQSTEKIETPDKVEVPDKVAYTFDASDFNEKYGKKYNREIKEEKELEDLFSAPSKILDYEIKLKTAQEEHGLTKKQFDDLKAEYESKKEALSLIDLKQYFANENLYKTNEMLKKYPDKDVSIMTQIGSMDLEKADPVDLLVKQARLNDADIYQRMDDSKVKEVLSGDFDGIDLNDPDSWDDVAKARISKAAKQARIEFKTLQDVELPVPINVEKVRQDFVSKEQERFNQTKQQWQPIVDKMVSNFTELSIPEDDGKELYKYTPELSDSFKAEVSKYVDFLAYTGQPINENTITDVLEGIKGRYIAKDLPKIMKAHALSISTKVNDEWHNKVNNDHPLSTKVAPNGNKMDIQERLAEFIGG